MGGALPADLQTLDDALGAVEGDARALVAGLTEETRHVAHGSRLVECRGMPRPPRNQQTGCTSMRCSRSPPERAPTDVNGAAPRGRVSSAGGS